VTEAGLLGSSEEGRLGRYGRLFDQAPRGRPRADFGALVDMEE
jgi:hypothetical protein